MTSLLTRLSDNHPSQEEDDYQWALPTINMLFSEIKMLLLSRVRVSEYETIPYINTSILNYGIDESFSKITDINARLPMFETRIINALLRFEPRISNMRLTSTTAGIQSVIFCLSANYMQSPFEMELRWDNCTGKFYFNE